MPRGLNPRQRTRVARAGARASGASSLHSTRLGRGAAGRVARAGASRGYSPPPPSRGGGGGGGGTRLRGGGGGGGVSRAGGGGGGRVSRPAAPARPRYAGPPPPTAAMIAQLASQIGGLNRQYGEAGATYKANVAQAGAARKTYLQQLADFYTQQQNQTASDFQARGLLQSGLYNEALANLGKQRAAAQGQYEADYRGQLADLLRTLTTTRSGIKQQKAQLSDRYNQQRADRDRILRLMGG